MKDEEILKEVAIGLATRILIPKSEMEYNKNTLELVDNRLRKAIKLTREVERKRVFEALMKGRNSYLFVHQSQRCFVIENIMQSLGFDINHLPEEYLHEEELKKEIEK